MMDAISNIISWPLTALTLAGSAIGFSESAFLRVANSGAAQSAAYLIAFMAGVSEMLGQSVVLVVNRVALYRFLASLALTGVSYLLTVVSWGAAIYLAALLTPSGPLAFNDFMPATGILALAFAPRLFGVFAIAPYFGGPLLNLLEAWTMALAIFGLHAGFGMSVNAAVFVGFLGWAASYGLRSFCNYLLAAPLKKLRLAVTGSPLDRTPQEILERAIARLSDEPRR